MWNKKKQEWGRRRPGPPPLKTPPYTHSHTILRKIDKRVLTSIRIPHMQQIPTFYEQTICINICINFRAFFDNNNINKLTFNYKEYKRYHIKERGAFNYSHEKTLTVMIYLYKLLLIYNYIYTQIILRIYVIILLYLSLIRMHECTYFKFNVILY